DWPPDDRRWFRYLTTGLSFWHHIPWLYAGNKELSRGGYLDCFLQVLRRCDPNIIGSFGRTALHEVAAMGDWLLEGEATRFALALLNAGARADRRDDLLLMTPLQWAVHWGREDVRKVLSGI